MVNYEMFAETKTKFTKIPCLGVLMEVHIHIYLHIHNNFHHEINYNNHLSQNLLCTLFCQCSDADMEKREKSMMLSGLC